MYSYYFQLIPLTPIHVGTGDTLEPFEYVVAGDTLYRFTMDDFLLALEREDQARFVEVIEQSVPATRRFVAEHVGAAVEVVRYTADVSPAARALYDGRMEGLGHPEVHTCIRTGDRAYVPGSSLKGALRTALLYHAMPKDSRESDARQLERSVFRFGRIQQDPFRAFKVGDGEPLAEKTHVRSVTVNTQHSGRWSEDVTMLIETIPGFLSDNVETPSRHPVTFDVAFYEYHKRAFRLNPGVVLTACRDFYGEHLTAERDYTSSLSQTAAAYDALADYAERMPDHACLVRMAWGSGRDAVTVGYALQNAPEPRSRRLTADGFPLGWAELAIFDAEGEPVAADEGLPGVAPPPEPEEGRPRSIHDLREGMELQGTVTNTVGFGAFVDLGIGKDGLIHISQLSEGYVKETTDIVQQGNRVRVRVLSVELARERIGLKLLEVIG
jgi:CRISPR/Cas system CSM-associated protein Csm5 (group 7 of RAMP superfamily)